jgi:DnaJ homologue, subfamily C, member 28, conserved domain
MTSAPPAGYAARIVAPRKPPELSFESWIEQQIQQARRDGRFDGLPGVGRPLPTDDGSDPNWWAKQLLRREQLDFLPPALELRRSVERALAALPAIADEGRVRALLEGLDAEIRRFNARAVSGPPSSQPPLDVEELIAAWRRAREEPETR